MNVLEFLSSIHIVEPNLSWMCGDRRLPTNKIGFDWNSGNIPFDIAETYLPNRALDSFFITEILQYFTTDTPNYLEYVFLATSLFAAEQIIRHNADGRHLACTEYCHVHARCFSPQIQAFLQLTRHTPILLDLEDDEATLHEQFHEHIYHTVSPSRLLTPYAIRNVSYDQEECTHSICSPLYNDALSEIGKREIGLVIGYRLKNANDYILRLTSLLSSSSSQATVLIFDKLSVILGVLQSLSQTANWNSIIFKKLSYRSLGSGNCDAIIVFQKLYIPTTVREDSILLKHPKIFFEKRIFSD